MPADPHDITPVERFIAFLVEHKITSSARPGAPPAPDFLHSHGWTVTIRKGRRSMTVPFYMGYGHNGREPVAADVLPCLVSDAVGFENARDFGDWCADYGYDSDSRRAHRIYTACRGIARRLKRFMGDDYETLVAACDGL